MLVLNNLFRRARGGIDSGCVVVGGYENAGTEALFTEVAEEACEQGRILIVLDGKQEASDRNDLINNHILKHLSGGSMGYVFCPDTASADSFDPLSACASTLDRASLIADLLVHHSMKPEYRADTATYFQYVMEITKARRIRDILKIDPRSALAAIPASDPDASFKQVFIDDFRTNTYRHVVAAISIFLHSGEGALMDGALNLGKVLVPGNVVVLGEPMPTSGVTVKYGLFKSVLAALMLGIRRYNARRAVILLRHADFIGKDDLEALINTTRSCDALLVWLPENIAPFVSEGGGAVLSNIDYLCVFRSDRTSAETWSGLFGHRERTRVSSTNTSPKSLWSALGVGSYASGGMGAPMSSWRGSRSITTAKEDRPNVTADQISILSNGRAWCRYPDGSFSEGRLNRR